MALIHIIMPTFRCGSYISNAYAELDVAVTEIARDGHDVLIVPVLNGSTTTDADALAHAIAKGHMPAHVIEVAQAGKNNAINVGLRHAHEAGANIIHIVDDDQIYTPNTLSRNVSTLLAMRDELGIQGLVGSRYLVQPARTQSLVAWIANLAFEQDQEAPKFCMGGSICAFTEDVPQLPPDELSVADDAYICNSFFARYSTLYQKTGFMPIVFPKDSEIRIRSAQKLGEYQRQQVRIRYGVLAAYSAFPEHADAMRSYFNWRFHCDEKLCPRHGWLHDLRETARWTLFSFLRRRANRRAEKMLTSGQVGVAWSVAVSSKSNPEKRALGEAGS